MTAQPRSLPVQTLRIFGSILLRYHRIPSRRCPQDHEDASPALSLTHAHGTAEAMKMASSTSRELGVMARSKEVMCHVHKSGSRVMW